MNEPDTFDVIVIGSGPGGYVAAIRAAQLGKTVCVVEKDKIGGVCLNMGCIPSKALIRQASLFRSQAGLQAMGVSVDASGFDYSRVYAASRRAADALSKGVSFLLKKNRVPVIIGAARLTGAHEVVVDDTRKLTAEHIIIATGSRPRQIPGFEFDGQVVLSSDHGLMLQKLPKRLLILGAGAIGVEFTHIMNAFGVEVQLVEMMDRILPLEDRDISETLRRSFVKRGVSVYTSTRAAALVRDAGGAAVTLEDREKKRTTLAADQVLVVAGRTPNTDALGLETCGIECEKGFVRVNENYETSCKGVYAIGDVVATPLLAHVASKEGEIAAEHLAGRSGGAKLDLMEIPSAVYCEPQAASFGYTAVTAQERGIACRESVVFMRAVGKAVATGETEGFVKLVHDPEGKELLGAHIAGPEATELIHELLLAKKARIPLKEIAEMIHAHPTIAEGIMEAARMAGGQAIQV